MLGWTGKCVFAPCWLRERATQPVASSFRKHSTAQRASRHSEGWSPGCADTKSFQPHRGDRIEPMPQSLANLLFHAVFSTSERRPIIPADLRPDLFAYIGGILRNLNCQPVQVGGVADHVHLLFRLARTVNLSEVIEKVKTGTSKWIKTKEGVLADFTWQAGYGAFSVSPEHEEKVTAYIINQDAHHLERGYQEELRALLRDAKLDSDERYLRD